MNDKALHALQNWEGAVHFGDRTNEADELRRYRDTRLTPEEVVNLNTFVGSQVEMLLVKNAVLKKALEESVKYFNCSRCGYAPDCGKKQQENCADVFIRKAAEREALV